MAHDVAITENEASAMLEGSTILTRATLYGEVPHHWLTLPLEQCTFVQSGIAKGRDLKGKTTVELPYLRVANVQDGHLDLSEMKTIKLLVSEIERYQLQYGDVVVTEGGDFDKLGRGFIWRGEVPNCVHQNHIFAIRPDPDRLNSEFLAYLIQSGYGKAYFLSVAHRTTNLASINSTKLKAFPVLLPPLAEQRAIAAALRAAQGAAQARRRLAELERERKAALMQALFTKGTRGEATKATEIGEVPESWEVVQLGSYCEFLQYGTSKFCNTDETGIPVLRIPNVIAGRVDVSDLKYIKLPEKEAESLRLAAGDLVFVRTNGNREYTGRCAVFSNELPEALFASYLIRARVKTDFLVPGFVQLYTMTAPGSSFLSGRSSNAADGKYNINTQTIRGVMLPMPSLAEQREIAGALRACDEVIGGLEREAALHEELFRALLEELMTGRVRVGSN